MSTKGVKLKAGLLLIFLTIIGAFGGCRKSIKKEASESRESVFFGVSNELKGLINVKEDSIIPKIAGVQPEASSFILKFYTRRNYKEAWSSHQKLNKNFLELMLLLNDARSFGLDTSLYNIAKIQELKNLAETSDSIQKNKILSKLDVLATNTYFTFATHLNKGVVDPKTGTKKFKGGDVKIDLVAHLNNSLKKENVAAELMQLQPHINGYINLSKALDKYLRINDLNSKTIEIPSCKGDSAECYSKIAQALIEKHYIDTLAAKDRNKIIESLKQFQKQHGLNATGKPSNATKEALAISNYDYYKQIAVNLERLRWESERPSKYIFVNIPAYKLSIVKNNKVSHQHRIIVGTPETPTPELTSSVSNIISNPYWHVPYSISSKEILPLIQKDPEYLASRSFKVYDRNQTPVDPSAVDWKSVSASNLSYSFKQDPGTFNSLGIIKFEFPNRHHVYLHDTPNRELFDKELRCFSHGCMRVEDPLKLSSFLLKDEGREETASMVDSLVRKGTHRYINLKRPVPIYVRYYTAEADEKGNIYFYKDIYGKDEVLKKQLFRK